MSRLARTGGAAILAVLLLVCVACATPAPSVPARDLIWTGDAQSGDLSQFQDTPWNTDGGGLAPDVVTDPRSVGDGHFAVRARILGAGTPGRGICCGSRSELVPKLADIGPGENLWFGFSTLLGTGFPVDATWQTITQWHEDSAGSPPLEISLQGGEYALSGGYGHPVHPMAFVRELGPARPGVWVDWVMHIVFSPDPNVGYVEIWQNGRLVLPRFRPESGTMYSAPGGQRPDVYLKVGYYRDAAISAPGTVYYENWKVGTSGAAVVPPGS